MAKSLKADILETEHFSSFFIMFLKSKLNLEYFEKKDQSHGLSITKTINCETGIYLNVPKSMLHATLREITF